MPVSTRREAAPSSSAASSSNNTLQRLPTASTSFQVQLPNHASSSATACPLNTSDASVLTASIMRSRAFAMATLQAQETLISGTDLPHLREALARLTSSSWLGVLEERHLLGQCAYPTCSRAPQRLSSASSSGPTYRLDPRSRRIEPDERMAPGGELTFCSKACWARAQWIRRWVLNKAREGEHDSKPDGLRGGNEEMDEGGRWQVDGDDQHIELLEDLEARGEVTLPEETQQERLARERSEVARAAAANHVSTAPRNASAPPPRRGTVEMSSSPPAAASAFASSSSRPLPSSSNAASLPLSRPTPIDTAVPLDTPMQPASPTLPSANAPPLRSPSLNNATRSNGPRRPTRTTNAASTAPSDGLIIIERGTHADREREAQQLTSSSAASDAMDIEPSSSSSVAPVQEDSMDELFRLANVAREQERRAGNWDDGKEENRLIEAIEGMDVQY